MPFIALVDENITLSDFYQLHLPRTELVTFSACKTSVGKWLEGEGLMSISRAFTYAGAQSVVASLWNAKESGTTVLMTDFYKYLSKKSPKDQALRQAKLELLNKGASPREWAAFVSIGNPAPVLDLEGGGFGWVYWLLVVFVILVICYRCFLV